MQVTGHTSAGSQPSAKPATGRGLPPCAGVGLKHQHWRDMLCPRTASASAGFVEVHAENYMGAGGAPHYYLEKIRADYALSVHGVGLSIGAHQPLDREHLKRLRHLLDRYQPESFSEHLAWSSHGDCFYGDLLPLPYDDETLQLVSGHVSQTQDALGRKILIENPSTYVEFTASTMEEIDFLKALAARTGCGLLLDVNNVHVSCTNHNRSASAYIDAFPMEAVGEMHLAGFAEDRDGAGAPLLIDAHGSAVDPTVWRLYERALARSGPVATLIEWDNDVPAFDVLAAEAAKASAVLQAYAAATVSGSVA